VLSKKVQVLSETIQKLMQCGASENLQNLLAKAHEADIAYVFGQFNVQEQAEILSLLPGDRQAEVISEMSSIVKITRLYILSFSNFLVIQTTLDNCVLIKTDLT